MENLLSEATRVFNIKISEPIVDIQVINLGVMNHKLKITTRDNTYLMRFYIVDGKNKITYEPGLLNRFKNIGVKVPKIAVTSKEINSNFDFIIYEWVEGVALSTMVKKLSDFQQKKIAVQLLYNLEKINKLEFENYGVLINEKCGIHTSWSAFLCELIDVGLDSLSRYDFFNKKYNLLTISDFLYEQQQSFKNSIVVPKFIWSDISFENLIIDSNKLVGLIDFEYSMCGDIRMVPSFLYAKEGDCLLFEVFNSIWIAKHGFRDDAIFKFYVLLKLLRLAPYLSQNLPNGKPRENFLEIFPGIGKILENFKL